MSLPYAEVIGDPIAQSKSPLIHDYWLRRLGIEGKYLATRVRADELADFLRTRRSDPNWCGCNVTIPHKEAVLGQLDELGPEAARVGAVNCIVPRAQGLVGFNTDLDGLACALDETALESRKAAIIGGGGAARAALVYLARRNTSEVVVLVRNPEKARSLLPLFPGKLKIGNFAGAAALLEGASAIINASPLGMRGSPPMPNELLGAVASEARATLFDMVYEPLKTEFLSLGRGLAIDGLTMLVGQARSAFKLFFGTRPPDPDRALAKILGADEPSPS